MGVQWYKPTHQIVQAIKQTRNKTKHNTTQKIPMLSGKTLRPATSRHRSRYRGLSLAGTLLNVTLFQLAGGGGKRTFVL